MNAHQYDVVIIGGGAAGLVAAKLARGLGKSVAIIEKNRIGGECTWTGCVPSKTLIHLAQLAQSAQKMKDLNISQSSIEINAAKIMEYVRAKRIAIAQETTPEILKKQSIDVIFGDSLFIDPKTIHIGDKKIRSQKFILAMGSRPFIPQIEGLSANNYLTNETLFEIAELPRSMIILGGGPIGVEIAGALNSLGVKITIVERGKQILSHEDPELSALLADHMKSQGIDIKTSCKLSAITNQGKTILCEQADGSKIELAAERLLVAVGRVPNKDNLGLENIGVKTTSQGIVVNNKLQTSVSHIYACGDVVGPYQFSHMASYQAITAMRNACIPFFKSKMDYGKKVWVTFSNPEFANAGLSEIEARKIHGDSIEIFRVPYNSIDRTIIDDNTFGMCKIICDRKGYILGAHILGARAGELIHEIQLGKTYKLKFRDFYSVIHAYPTYSELIWKGGRKAYLQHLSSNIFVKIVAWLFGAKKSKN